jgi:hypothetical protein
MEPLASDDPAEIAGDTLREYGSTGSIVAARQTP